MYVTLSNVYWQYIIHLLVPCSPWDHNGKMGKPVSMVTYADVDAPYEFCVKSYVILVLLIFNMSIVLAEHVTKIKTQRANLVRNCNKALWEIKLKDLNMIPKIGHSHILLKWKIILIVLVNTLIQCVLCVFTLVMRNKIKKKT